MSGEGKIVRVGVVADLISTLCGMLKKDVHFFRNSRSPSKDGDGFRKNPVV